MIRLRGYRLDSHDQRQQNGNNTLLQQSLRTAAIKVEPADRGLSGILYLARISPQAKPHFCLKYEATTRFSIAFARGPDLLSLFCLGSTDNSSFSPLPQSLCVPAAMTTALQHRSCPKSTGCRLLCSDLTTIQPAVFLFPNRVVF